MDRYSRPGRWSILILIGLILAFWFGRDKLADQKQESSNRESRFHIAVVGDKFDYYDIASPLPGENILIINSSDQTSNQWDRMSTRERGIYKSDGCLFGIQFANDNSAQTPTVQLSAIQLADPNAPQGGMAVLKKPFVLSPDKPVQISIFGSSEYNNLKQAIKVDAAGAVYCKSIQ